MELSYTNTRKILRSGRASLTMQTYMMQFPPAVRTVANCYDGAVKALEAWAVRDFLPSTEAKLNAAPRKGRLHYLPPVLRFTCDGTVIEERWLSVAAVISLEEEGTVTCLRDYRVWDLQTGLLCPIEHFLPRKEAARYLRWAFRLVDDAVWGIPLGTGKRGGGGQPVCAGKLKYISPPS